MNNLRISLLTATLLLHLVSVAQSATFAVLPGTSIQAQIDLAADGDIVAIFGGIYDQDVTVNKRIRLVEVSGEEVTITGNMTFNGVVDCPPFEGFTVGSYGKNINVTNTTGLVFNAIDHRNGNSVVVSGASTVLKMDNCQLKRLNANAGLTEISKSSLTDSISQAGGNLHVTAVTVAGNFDTSGTAAKTIAFRATVAGDCNWVSKRSWFGYGKTRSFNFTGSNAKVVFVGSEINRLGSEAVGMNLKGTNNSYIVTNSYIHNVFQQYQDDDGGDNAIELGGAGHIAYIQNNYFKLTRNSNPYSGLPVNQAALQISSTNVIIRNNIMVGSCKLISAPFGVQITNNQIYDISNPYGGDIVLGGALATNTFNGNPLIVNNNPYQLEVGSPCINKGTEDALYNDRDGSRNDIGPFGGAWYDPEGWTTTKPVLISFDLSPEIVLQGVDSDVTLDEIVAVSAP